MKRLFVYAPIFMLITGFNINVFAGGFETIMKLPINKRIIEPPLLKPFTDNHDWMLSMDLKYSIGGTGVAITVPAGFVTDFASIPEFLWSYGLSPHGKYSKASIIHDYLYWTQNCTKAQADNILLIAMKESDVSSIKENEIYAGVNLGGRPSWNSNSVERKRHLPRVIPIEYQKFPGNVTWKDYRQFLVSKEVKDPTFDLGASYCKYGNSTKVPR